MVERDGASRCCRRSPQGADESARPGGRGARAPGSRSPPRCACRRESRRCPRRRRSAHWAAAFELGPSTDNPPTPESKKRRGELGSTDTPLRGGSAEAIHQRCFTQRRKGAKPMSSFFAPSRLRVKSPSLSSASQGAPRSGLLPTRAMTREMLFALALGYLLGSIPFGLVLTRIAGKGDVREIGSGQYRRDQVLRTGSKCARRADAGPRLPQGDRGGSNLRRGCSAGDRRHRRGRSTPRASLSCLARASRRQGGRDLAWRPHSAAVAGRPRLCRGLGFVLMTSQSRRLQE